MICMTAEGALVFDIFDGLCLVHLTDREARWLRWFCGLHTGQPPMSVQQLASKCNLPEAKVYALLGSALTKLPRRELERLKQYLDDDDHPFHRNLTGHQRSSFRSLILMGLEAHNRRADLTPHPDTASVPRAAPPVPRLSAVPQIRDTIIEGLLAALRQLDRPAHYTTAHRVAGWNNVPSPDKVRQIMEHSRAFVPLGGGVFALAEWRNRLERDGQTLLRYCPPLPIDTHDRPEKLFELFLATRDWLAQSLLTYGELWERTVRRSFPPNSAQDLFDLWYALGLCPDVNYHQRYRNAVQLTMPAALDVASARRFALETVVKRLYLMPNILATVANLRRPSVEQVNALLYADPRDGADTLARLRLLQALGAVRHNKGWQLTRTGLELLDTHPVHVDNPPADWPSSPTSHSSTEDIGFLDI